MTVLFVSVLLSAYFAKAADNPLYAEITEPGVQFG